MVPKIDTRKESSVLNIISYYKKHVEEYVRHKDKINEKETYKTIVYENYVVRLPERLVRRMEESRRREAEREEADRRRVEDRKRRDKAELLRGR